MKRIAFIALVLAALMLCACTADVPTAQITEANAFTEAPTSTPTEAPMPEPTDTPAPTAEPELPRIEPWDGTAENAGTLIPEYWYPASMDELLERSADVVRVRIGGKGYEKHVYPTENGADYTAYCAIYDAEIVESYMGETNKGDTIRVEIWCGMEQDGRIALEEHPLTLTEGEEYVLFLTEDRDFDGLRYPTANDDGVHLVMHDSYQGSDGAVTEVEWVSLGFDIWPEESFSWLENLKNTH